MTKDTSKAAGYNERLFSGKGLRSYLHNSRFVWFSDVVARFSLDTRKIIELGCFDGRLLSHLNQEPESYVGLDADWEGGLSRAQKDFDAKSFAHFINSKDPNDLAQFEDNSFHLAVALETLEHIAPQDLDSYLKELARVVNGHLVVSVPNEKGPVFAAKWTVKKLFFGGAEKYSLVEFWNALLGRMERVERLEHKGFDHGVLKRQIEEHFVLICCEPVPFRWMPKWTGFTIGFVAKTKPAADG